MKVECNNSSLKQNVILCLSQNHMQGKAVSLLIMKTFRGRYIISIHS